MSNQQSPLKLYLLDINSQNKAILEFFVAGAGREFFVLVNSADQAEVFITDFDFPDARENWQELSLQGRPSLVLAMQDPEMSDVEWLSKPMTSDALIDAAKKYMPQVLERREADKTANQSKSIDAVSQRPAPLAHDRIGSRVSSVSASPFSAKKAVSAIVSGASAAVAKDNMGMQGKPLVNLDDGGAITLERPSAKNDSLPESREEIEKIDAEETVSKAQTVSENSSKLEPIEEISEAEKISETLVVEELSSEDEKDILGTSESVEDNQETPLTEEEILDEQRQNSPIYVRDKLSPEQARLRWQELCGSKPHYMPSELKDIRNTGYNCESHLQGSLIAALRLSKQTHQVVLVKYEPYEFFVIHDDGLVVSHLDPKTSEFTALCSNAVRPGQINLHILDSEQSREIRENLEDHRDYAFELEAFIWITCLVSSQGRLPTHFERDRSYLLKHWPNFTRMENFPFAMKIAALWHHEPNRVAEIAEKLEIPQRYIIAFFNAAMGLSLFEQDPDKVQSKLIEPPKKKQSGIIARLFSRLAGGMSNA